MRVAVCVLRAENEADAHAQCRRSKAYRSILKSYPSTEWHRKHVSTERHYLAGLWMIEFEVTPKQGQAATPTENGPRAIARPTLPD